MKTQSDRLKRLGSSERELIRYYSYLICSDDLFFINCLRVYVWFVTYVTHRTCIRFLLRSACR